MIVIPEALAVTQVEVNGEAGREWIAALPGEQVAVARALLTLRG